MPKSNSGQPLVEILADEFLARHKKGDRPTIREYCEKHPEIADEIRDVFEALLMIEDLRPDSGDASGSYGSSVRSSGKRLEQVGDYRILAEIGRGGMGVVYEAEQQALGRRVALKVLLRTIAGNGSAVVRFQREAKAAARMHHTNIVPVFDVGQDGEHLYYAMQRIHGQGLDVVIDDLKRLRGQSHENSSRMEGSIAASLMSGHFEQEKLGDANDPDPTATYEGSPPSSASLPGQSELSSVERNCRAYYRSVAQIGMQTASALSYAHARGIVHRDIKPGNLLLDTAGNVWVTDFGLAKTGDSGMTHTGDILGTIRYMSPERFRGQCDVRADVYALGMTLYEMLTMEPAYVSGDRLKLMELIRNSEPASPRSVDARIPRDLETIVMKAIDKDARRRYQSMDEMWEDLQRFVHDEPIKARRIGSVERLGRWCRRNPVVASLTAFVVVLVTAVAIGASVAAFHFGRMAVTEQGLRIEAQYARHDAEQAKEAAVDSEKKSRESEAKSRQALVAMSTSYGLVSAERNDPGQGVLWFAHAARLAGPGTEEEQANRARVSAWSRQALQPIRALPQRQENLHNMAFHPDCQFLLTQTVRIRRNPRAVEGEECTLWDLARETSLAWPAGISKASSAAWSPDGRLLALGTPEGEVLLCTFPAYTEVRRLPYGRPIHLLQFSPDGHYLAIAGADTVRVWDCQGGTFTTPELEHPQRVTTLTFHPSGQRLVTGCVDHKARVFPISSTTSESQLTVRQNSDHLIAPAFVDDGRGLLTVPAQPQGGLRQVNWLNAESGALERVLKLSEGHQGIYSLAVSPDGKTIAIGSADGAQIWEVARGEHAVSPFLRVKRPITSLVFSPDGRTLLMGSEDHTLQRWSVPDGNIVGGPLAHSTEVRRVASSADGRLLATAQGDGLVRIWVAPTDNPRDHFLPLDGLVSKGTFSPDGRYVLPTGHSNWNCSLRSTQVYEVATGQPAGPALPGEGILVDAAFSSDGRQVAAIFALSTQSERRSRLDSGELPGRLKLWDWRKGELTCQPLSLPSEPRSLAYRPDGQRLAVLCGGGQTLLIEAGTGQILTQWNDFAGRRTNTSDPLQNGLLRFSPDGQSIVILSRVGSVVRVCEATSGQERYQALAHRDRCTDARFSADGRWLATASEDSTVRIWEVETGQPLADPLVHPAQVTTAVFSQDGTRVLTGCSDGMARLWDWRAGRILWALEHEHTVNAVAFHPNDRWVLTASGGGFFRVWDARTGKPVAPPLPTLHEASSVAVTPDGNYAVVGDYANSGEMSALPVFYLGDLSAGSTTVDLDDLCAWGELLSGRRVVDSGSTPILTAEEWLTRWRDFRQRHPDHGRLNQAEGLGHAWREAAACETAHRWRSAIQQLDRLLTAYPVGGLLIYRRGLAYAELEQWDRAAADFARAGELVPDKIEIWKSWAFACLAAGDEERYLYICASVLQRFGEAGGSDALAVTGLCTLRPSAVPDPSQLLRIEENAVANRKLRQVTASVLYRAGQFEKLIQQINDEIAVTNNLFVPGRRSFILAMAHHRLGHAAEARKCLDQAILWAEKNPLSWEHRVELEYLRREAQELIEGKAAEPKK